MALFIDIIYVLRELTKLIYVVVTSPFAIVGSLLMLGSQY
jgi:hypothetical protein